MTAHTPPSVSRRRLLGGAAALAVAAPLVPTTMPALAASTAATSSEPIHPDDARLVRLWRRLEKVNTLYAENRRQQKAAVATMPEWARWVRQPDGWFQSAPAWTPAMLRRHGIPAEIGSRPTRKDIETLNADCLRRACVPLVRPDAELGVEFGASFLAWSYAENRITAPPEVTPVIEANERRLAALHRRTAAQRREERRAGLDALNERSERIVGLQTAILDRIRDAPAHGLIGALVKLRAWSREAIEYHSSATVEEMEGFERLAVDALKVLEKTDAAKALADPFSGTADLFGAAGEGIATTYPAASIKSA